MKQGSLSAQFVASCSLLRPASAPPLTITSKTHEQFRFTWWRSQIISITLLFSLAYDFKPWKKSSVGSSNGIVINASTQWSFTRGLHVRTMQAFLAAVQMALQKKKRKKGKSLLCKHQKQTHKQWRPSESPIHLFSCWVLVVPGRSRLFSFHAVRHAHFRQLLKCKWTLI